MHDENIIGDFKKEHHFFLLPKWVLADWAKLPKHQTFAVFLLFAVSGGIAHSRLHKGLGAPSAATTREERHVGPPTPNVKLAIY